jgi:hypothetical protein
MITVTCPEVAIPLSASALVSCLISEDKTDRENLTAIRRLIELTHAEPLQQEHRINSDMWWRDGRVPMENTDWKDLVALLPWIVQDESNELTFTGEYFDGNTTGM